MASIASPTQSHASARLTGDGSEKVLGHQERAVLERQLDIPAPKSSLSNLFRYSTRLDKIILSIAIVCSIAAGAINPVMTLVFGRLASYFQKFLAGTTDAHEFSTELSKFTLYYVYLGIGQFFLAYISIVGHTYVGEHITAQIREEYLAAVLRQNIAFFDTLSSGEITNHMTAETSIILNGTSSKVGTAITAIFTLIAAYIVAFSQSWKLTLILTSTLVAVILSITICSAFVVRYEERSLAPNAAAGTITEEAFSSIRNVTAFNAQHAILQSYKQYMSKAQRWALKGKISVATSIGFITGVVCFNYGLAFWMGARFLIDGQLDLGNILTTVLSIMIGATHLGIIGPSIHGISGAVAATGHIFSVIDRQSPIDPNSTEGIELPDPQGTIELSNIGMVYPSRLDAVITQNLSITFPKGKTTALVGASGSGKSTIIGLIERFYNPISGHVLFDEVDIQNLNLRWLRQQMALVQQEPTIFNTTVAANIAHGLIGSKYEDMSPEEKKKLIEEAAKMSNASDFIKALPQGYDTLVGQQGTLLSGGQKQRIAIARAIIADPKVLLLDEATSALDTRSERIVQTALDKAAEGRTTILIAHRLSTVKRADSIIVMSKGAVVEQGTHDELISRQGAYYDLVHAQKLDEEETSEKTGENGALEDIDQFCFPQGSEATNDILEGIEGVKLEDMASLPDPKHIIGHHKKKYSLWTLIKFIASFNKKETGIMIFGLIASIFAGGGTPVQAILFAKAIVSLSRPPSQYRSLQGDIDFWSLMFLVLGIEQFLAYLGQGVAFAVCSERLLRRTKGQALRSILRQDISFFDNDKNGPGALSTFLSAEVGDIAGLSGTALGTILTATTTLVASIVLSCTFYWKLGLVCTSTIPILLGCGFLRIWVLGEYQAKANTSYQASATYACEAIAAIRTVASLTREKDVSDEYHRQMLHQRKDNLGQVLKSGFLYAVSQAAVLFVTALAFWYGGTLIASSEIGLYQFFLCFSAIVFGTQMAGGIFAFAPEVANAKTAAQSLKAQLDTRPSIDTWSTEGQKIDQVRGQVEFKDVHFSYPSRPNEKVLSGLSFKAEPGSYIALVGGSGCGKSTTIALLESFYSASSGQILLDGKNISKLNVLEYRKHLALVIQEPSLYHGTIRENILLGVEDGTVSDTQVQQACKSANIYDFIMSLPEGYETIVGSKGSMLSGGQKQRIAIARALLRDPAVLLLDEATSALDSQSEEVVQAALDAAATGRTTIAIAHRLSTIQKADVINVFDKGTIVESGSHQELLALKGMYFDLVNSQRLNHETGK